jgi:hypothetical protein
MFARSLAATLRIRCRAPNRSVVGCGDTRFWPRHEEAVGKHGAAKLPRAASRTFTLSHRSKPDELPNRLTQRQ